MIEEGLSKMDKITIEEIYEYTKINWTNFYIGFHDCQNDSPIEFEVMPDEYLQFAKKNLKSNTTQNRIDAMCNAKRSIECQIDLLISTFGYDYKTFDSRKNYPEVKSFIKDRYEGEQYTGLMERLKLLNILGLAPTLIISNIRSLRNQMEHEYSVPSYDEVKRAIEVAELFINSSNRKLSLASTHLTIGNNLKSDDEKKQLMDYYNIAYPYILIEFNVSNSINTVTVSLLKKNLSKNIESDKPFQIPIKLEDKIYIELKPKDKFYINMIHCLLNEECSMLPIIFNCCVDKKFINYTSV